MPKDSRPTELSPVSLLAVTRSLELSVMRMSQAGLLEAWPEGTNALPVFLRDRACRSMRPFLQSMPGPKAFSRPCSDSRSLTGVDV